MKKTIIYITLLLFCITSYAQKRVEFPHAVILRDVNNNKFSTKLFYNFGKPVIIEFWATHCKPCIRQLNSFKEVYNEWQQKYGVKIIVISIDPKSRRKKALKIIKDNDWPFQFYFDTEKKLYHKIRGGNLIPQAIIYDKDFNAIKKIHGIRLNIAYIRTKDGKLGKKIRRKGKYSHLDCDLTHYEEVLKTITNQQ
jgi:thiol-disulfide isomerase/thioredoxin